MNQPLQQASKKPQKLNSYFAPNILPQQGSTLKIGPGKYSLGADSTIPFATFKGSADFQKTFSWGELVEVPEGELVTVFSASFMQGDIQINSGWDPCTRPARISVPVPLDITDVLGAPFYTGRYPADVRLARKAFLKFQLFTEDYTMNIVTIGQSRKHSWPSISTFDPSGFPFEATYTNGAIILPFSVASQQSLGYTIGNEDEDSPMALGDIANFYMGVLQDPIDDYILNGLMFYCMEY